MTRQVAWGVVKCPSRHKPVSGGRGDGIHPQETTLYGETVVTCISGKLEFGMDYSVGERLFGFYTRRSIRVGRLGAQTETCLCTEEDKRHLLLEQKRNAYT